MLTVPILSQEKDVGETYSTTPEQPQPAAAASPAVVASGLPRPCIVKLLKVDTTTAIEEGMPCIEEFDLSSFLETNVIDKHNQVQLVTTQAAAVGIGEEHKSFVEGTTCTVYGIEKSKFKVKFQGAPKTRYWVPYTLFQVPHPPSPPPSDTVKTSETCDEEVVVVLNDD